MVMSIIDDIAPAHSEKERVKLTALHLIRQYAESVRDFRDPRMTLAEIARRYKAMSDYLDIYLK